MKKLLIFIVLISQVFACEEQLLDSTSETVAGGSYKYYNLMHEGFIRVKLESLVGDADLYVSQTTTKPTYEPHQYCLKSTTCGDDTVLIPNSFRRPVTIGVYGHPFHNTNEFRLSVYKVFANNNLSYDEVLGSTCKHYKNPNQMFLEVLHEDGLVVTAKGLGIETVFANILKAYTDAGNLVVVLGTTNHDEQYFIDLLESFGMKQLPRVVTSEFSADERQIMYLEGGILFLSGPILVLDLLKSRLPLNLVTGILVYRAHNILNSYQEAFALRLYRQNNKTGFIKAFTNSALAFSFGYSQVERVMKALFVKKLYLWPRFHSLVNNSLGKQKADVIELHLKVTPKMVQIQTALLDIMNFIVNELKRLNKYLDLEELTVENAIAKKFHKQLQQQLDPIWHQLSSTTKQLISDLKMLRSLLTSLTHEDCVAFYAMLNRLRTMDYAEKNSGWLMLDSVDSLFVNSKERVYNVKNEFKPEANPKWTALTEILSEIQDQRKSNVHSVEPEKILILVRDSSTCHQLRNYLTMGAKQYLLYEALKKLPKNEFQIANQAKETQPSEEKADESGAENDEEKDGYILTLSQEASERIASEASDKEQQHQTLFEDCSQLGELEISSIKTSAPVIILEALKKNGDPMSLLRTLSRHMPRNVIMYAADVSAVRQLEVYQNNNPSIELKVFFLIYKGSVEEQEYLTSLRREKEAFHLLINTKTTMVVPEDQDGKSDDSLALAIQTSDQAQEASTRKGGIAAQPTVDIVIVDMREFRSELPSILYSRGMKIEPITLQIGDYILSPEICVERKSVSDLIGSLNSGRLYNQATAMSRHYAKPMLLIEFDPNKPFCFQGNYYASKDIQNSNVTSKLQLLTLHFPRLKLVWSPGPHATAQLFEELKQGKEQPNGAIAAQIGIGEGAENKELVIEKYNARIKDFLAKLPGVTTKNLPTILNKGISLEHLIQLSQDELAEMLANKNEASVLYNALHEKNVVTEQNSKLPVKKVPKGRGKRIFTKIKQPK